VTVAGVPLRVGLILDGVVVPGWVADAIDDVDACPVAEIVGVLIAPRSSRHAGRPPVLYELYRRLDRRRFGADRDPLDEVDLANRLGRLPQLGATQLDVILSFCGDVPFSGTADFPRCGVWSHRVDDPRVFAGARVWESQLRRVTREGAADVIYRSFSAADPLSLHRTRARVCSKSSRFAVRKLRAAHADGEVGVVQHDAPEEVSAGYAPTNRQLLSFGRRAAVELTRRKMREAVARQQWFIAYRRRCEGLPTAEAFRDATILAAPRDRFYADPCLVDRRGETYLFFEEFRFARRRGVISCCRLTPDGRCTAPELALERPYHLSYPFVFFDGDDAFMLAETAANGTIELYRADPFPDGWALDCVLLSDVRAVDPTLIEHAGRYWLFANVAARGASNDDELHVFSSGAVRGPWEPHPRNPVVSDVRRARPAGRPFLDERGSLIRPSQDCSQAYGSAVVFNRIQALTEREYDETPIGRLGARWRVPNLGTHTYARATHWEAIDGRAWAPRLRRSRPSRPGSS
jgi:hypothetical protein